MKPEFIQSPDAGKILEIIKLQLEIIKALGLPLMFVPKADESGLERFGK